MNGLFITGTDTGVGKTLVCGLLAGYLHRHGHRVITQKWVQTGCTDLSEDIEAHCALGGLAPHETLRSLTNPYLFALPASPHLAAEAEGRKIDPAVITQAYHALANHADLVLVEGAGGAMVPLTRQCLTIDLVAELRMPTLLVVGNKLGCVNHALLTIEALRHRSIPVVGMIFNTLQPDGDPMILADNPRIVTELSGVPLLGSLPYLADPLAGQGHFDRIAEALMHEWRKLIDARLA